jgi:hypothetical protein
MANYCTTSLSIQTDDEKRDLTEVSQEIKQWLNENYFYPDTSDMHCEETCLLEMDGETKWNVQEDLLVECSKKFDIKIRAIGREDGCAFVQVVCVDNGEIVQSESIGYAF